jgi:hypothetical protein
MNWQHPISNGWFVEFPYQAAIWQLGSQFVTAVDGEFVYSLNLVEAKQAAYNLVFPKIVKRASLAFRPVELEAPSNLQKVVLLMSTGDFVTAEWHDMDSRFYVGGAAQEPATVKGWDRLPTGLV